MEDSIDSLLVTGILLVRIQGMSADEVSILSLPTCPIKYTDINGLKQGSRQNTA